MKRLIIFLIVLIGITQANAKMRVFIGIGQSNMQGAAGIDAEDKAGISDRLWHLPTCNFNGTDRKPDTFRKAIPPLHEGLCPLDYFGRVMTAEFPQDTIVLINVSVGGTKIQLFDRDSCDTYANNPKHPKWFKDFLKRYNFKPRQRLLEATRFAMSKGGSIEGILLHQGESNNGDTAWPAMVAKIYKELLDDLQLKEENVPLIAGEVVSAGVGGACGATMNPIINKLPELIANCAVASSEGLPVYTTDKMNVHFNTVGMRTLGLRYAQAYLKLTGKAHFAYFTYTGSDERFNKKINHSRQYFNPILAGYQPDPSFCRAGSTYYLVNSSFTAFPGVPIYKSRDLVNWKQIGHVLNRDSQLPLKGQRVSGGIFAPAISYNPKNKTFYMITTNVGWGNFFVKTKDPEKGWSEPIRLPHVGGIDPSFFFDENGKGYIVNNDEPVGGHDYEGQRSIFMHYFDVEGDSTTGAQKEILRGGTHVQEKPIWIEGPHMFRKDGYYYLMCAEGGTGAWHSEVILRAKSPEGPWEEYTEGNPILTQRTGLDPNRPDIVTSAGHADILQDTDGKWWAVFLGCRPYEGDIYNTGRDTYMLPVTWKNGWPTILEKGKAVPTVVNKPGLDKERAEYLTGNFTYTDRFDTAKLNPRWMFLRNIEGNFMNTGSGLTLTPKTDDITGFGNPAAIFARQQHTNFSAETEVTFRPKNSKDLAGFALLQKENFNIVFGKTIHEGKEAVTLTHTERSSKTVAHAFVPEGKAVRLKIEGKGRYYNFLYAIADGEFKMLAEHVDASNLSTNRSGGFIGACIGLYTTTNNVGVKASENPMRRK